MSVALVWFRRDLRLADNPALQAALDAGHDPVPVYVHAPDEEGRWAPGAASRAWLHRSLSALAQALQARGSRLIVRRGPTQAALDQLIQDTGARAIYWNRLYEPALVERDATIKQALRARDLVAESGNAALLVEPWEVRTGGGPYRVFTPFWKNVRPRLQLDRVPDAPDVLPAVSPTLAGDAVDALRLLPTPNWDHGFWTQWQPGEAGAADQLDVFVEGAADAYLTQRDLPDRVGTSRLSPHLHFGELSPRQIVARLRREPWKAAAEAHVEGYVRELGWREFAHHLLFHFPATTDQDLNPRFAQFAWAPPAAQTLQAWQRGRTGVPIVDAGLREMWTTGWMHNRVRMIVGSFLTKNLRMHWLHGARWFWDTLVDADLANNTLGWQWIGGTGADAAPYFRVFNPVTQAQRFDPAGVYIRRWIPELGKLPDAAIHAPWERPTLLAQLAPDYPQAPLVDLRVSREAALAAYQASK